MPAMIERGARLYHAYRAIIRANGYTSAAFRCWPENNEPYIGISACLAMGLLLANGDLTAAACESDWPTAVAQSIGTLLSGQPGGLPGLGQLHRRLRDHPARPLRRGHLRTDGLGRVPRHGLRRHRPASGHPPGRRRHGAGAHRPVRIRAEDRPLPCARSRRRLQALGFRGESSPRPPAA